MKKLLSLILALFLLIQLNTNMAYAQIGDQVPLDPTLVPQFVDPLAHFSGLRVDIKAGGNLVIKTVPNQQVAVSTGTVLENGVVGTDPGAGVGNYWVYQVSKDGGTTFTPPLWPSFTIEASVGNPVYVEYINDLWGQTYADVNLVADQSIHWAMMMMPTGDPLTDPYTGDVPIVPHLHGGEVPSESDGGPDAWWTPGMDMVGPAWGIDGTDQYYYYPGEQEAATIWYHDHLLGATRLNVYAGLAGFYFLRGPDEEDDHLPGWSGDDLVQEVAPAGTSGVFNPNPYLPEIEIAIQDRMFDTYGELYFPNDPPNPFVHPFWTPEFFGDIITVNGRTWPYLSVAPRKYRFHFLDGSNARFYQLWLQDLNTGAKGPVIYQVGTDGGLLETPAAINPKLGKKLFMGPGERADVVIDFARATPGQVWTLMNSANAPYPDGDAVEPSTTGRIMQFVVNGNMISAKNHSRPGKDRSKLPTTLRPDNPMVELTDFQGNANVEPAVVRQLTLNEHQGEGGPLEVLVNNTKWTGTVDEVPIPGFVSDGHGNYLSELPVEGTTEIWQIINTTMDAHPMHLHLTQFQLISRQPFDMDAWLAVYNSEFEGGEYIPAGGPPNDYFTPNSDGAVGGNPAVDSYLMGSPNYPQNYEQGWKDVVKMFPGEVSTIIVRFAPQSKPLDADPEDLVYGFDPSLGPGYVWHCHIVDHEDNEMMRPYMVQASPARSTIMSPGKGGVANNTNPVKSASAFDYTLGQNYPNPVTTATEIQFTTPVSGNVQLNLFNTSGDLVQTVLNAQVSEGTHIARIEGENLTSGIYYYQLKAGQFSEVKKMLVVK
jgi:FtsP/CotA-like multicopper oxidase with cupredoxin domain